MKVGIITFQETNNYGAVLQNYALQQAIKSLGVCSETINYKSRYIGRPYSILHLKNKGLANYLFGIAGYIVYSLRTHKTNLFRKHISYSKKVKRNKLSNLNNDYDLFITGSDQVFNYKLTGEDYTYMLDFVTDKVKCNSYAASLGLKCLDDDIKNMYKKLLSNFEYITVREETAAKLLSDTTGRDVITVADPCILLQRPDWEKVAVEPKIKKPYIFVYELAMSGEVVKLANKIATENNFEIVFAPFPMGAFSKGKYHISAGPGEILGLIKNAEYVITDSFHGTLLSIIFNKQFFTKIADKKIGSRITDLLSKCNLNDRLVENNSMNVSSINYTEVNSVISKFRMESIEILKNILKIN